MDDNDKLSWRSAVKGLKILGEKLMKEEGRKKELLRGITLPTLRKYEIKDIKKAIKFAKKLL